MLGRVGLLRIQVMSQECVSEVRVVQVKEVGLMKMYGGTVHDREESEERCVPSVMLTQDSPYCWLVE